MTSGNFEKQGERLPGGEIIEFFLDTTYSNARLPSEEEIRQLIEDIKVNKALPLKQYCGEENLVCLHDGPQEGDLGKEGLRKRRWWLPIPTAPEGKGDTIIETAHLLAQAGALPVRCLRDAVLAIFQAERMEDGNWKIKIPLFGGKKVAIVKVNDDTYRTYSDWIEDHFVIISPEKTGVLFFECEYCGRLTFFPPKVSFPLSLTCDGCGAPLSLNDEVSSGNVKLKK